MRRSRLTIVIVTLILSAGGWGHLRGQAAPEESRSAKEIRKIVADWTEAFNNHDSKAVAELFAPAATFVNVYGELSQGRSEIEASRAALHRDHFEGITDGTMTTAILEIRFLTPDFALSVVKWTLDSPSLGSFSTHSTMVLSNTEGRWAIFAFHTTPIRPPEWRQEQGQDGPRPERR